VCNYCTGFCGRTILVCQDKERSYEVRVFESRFLRRKFKPKGSEMTGVWRKLCTLEPHDRNTSIQGFHYMTVRKAGVNADLGWGHSLPQACLRRHNMKTPDVLQCPPQVVGDEFFSSKCFPFRGTQCSSHVRNGNPFVPVLNQIHPVHTLAIISLKSSPLLPYIYALVFPNFLSH
jgi:hypothetical protein